MNQEVKISKFRKIIPITCFFIVIFCIVAVSIDFFSSTPQKDGSDKISDKESEKAILCCDEFKRIYSKYIAPFEDQDLFHTKEFIRLNEESKKIGSDSELRGRFYYCRDKGLESIYTFYRDKNKKYFVKSTTYNLSNNKIDSWSDPILITQEVRYTLPGLVFRYNDPESYCGEYFFFTENRLYCMLYNQYNEVFGVAFDCSDK